MEGGENQAIPPEEALVKDDPSAAVASPTVSPMVIVATPLPAPESLEQLNSKITKAPSPLAMREDPASVIPSPPVVEDTSGAASARQSASETVALRSTSNVELPSIGLVTSMKPTVNIPPLNKGNIGALPSRQNIIQLPGNMLGSGKGGPIVSPHPHPSMPPPAHVPSTMPASRVMSPPYGVPPGASGPSGYVMMGYQGATSGQAIPSSQQPPQKMELQDAFAYLDRVKAEFSDQPDVYNRFLQIMREFKANAIDANGVIVRVVQLFKGHKALIQGFNAFLPRTHHIDPIVAETGILPPHLMQVAASMGIPLNAQGIPTSLPAIPAASSTSAPQYMPPPPHHHQPPQWMPEGSGSGPSANSPYYHHPPSSSHPGYPPSGYPTSTLPPQGISRPANIANAPLAGAPPISTANASVPQAGAGLAVATPSGKKSSAQFVRAISYVKKIKHRFSHDPEVYKTFLAALHSYHKEQKTIFEVYMEVASLFADHQDLLEEFVLFLPENEAAAITSRLSQNSMASQSVPAAVRGEGRSTVAQSSAPAGTIPKRPAQQTLPPSKTSKRARQAAAMSNRTAEESAFFERVKRYLGDKTAYAEFLKCLNLFCQDIIKMSDLVHLVQRFIGPNEELFVWFKRYIGYKDSTEVEAHDGSAWKLKESLVNEHGELNLQACKKTGSYRIYPKSHILSKSSHRTSIGHEALNDSMVSCPVFNSEDSTFIASKKNQFEEALFRCEDERFEMDLLIEYNLATIAVFEPLARKLESLSEVGRANFTLGATLGGSSTVIYKKAIRKIYGDKTDEIINGLQKNPAVAVPVVLRRLKQKDEEWRRVQRDWNKIWRDLHTKNYYKALDHQGIEFKTNDRRNISGRSLVSEIENIASDRRRAIERGDSLASTVPGHHMEFACKNYSSIAEHLSKLITAFVKHSPGMGHNDRKAILRFVSSFLPSFFSLSTNAPPPLSASATESTSNVVPSGTTSDSASDSEHSMSESEDSVRDDKKTNKQGSPTIEMLDKEVNTTFSPAVLPSQQIGPVLLFANNNLYVLTRLLQVCMDRLEKMKVAAGSANGTPFFTEKKNVVASFLDLQEQSETPPGLKGDFYGTLLVLLKQFVCNNIDPTVFEERVRFMFGTAAYPIFTFDKLLQTFVKQVQTVLSDPSCEQLVRLFDSWNSRKNNMRLSEYSVRIAVENIVAGKENVYRIEFSPKDEKLTIQLVERLGDSSNGTTSAEGRWSSYVDEFVKLESNGRYLDPKSRIYLNRNRRKEAAMDPAKLYVIYNLECKIAINTYKLFYVENTEDFLLRMVPRKHDWSKTARSRFSAWLESFSVQMTVDK